MIISNLNSMSANNKLDLIIKKVMKSRVESYPDGISEIQGKDIFVNRVRDEAKAIDDTKAEAHEEYVDVHVILSGQETIGYMINSDSLCTMNYVFEDDCMLQAELNNEQFVTLDQGQFCIFFPREWHRPMVKREFGYNRVDKAVIKVRASIL